MPNFDIVRETKYHKSFRTESIKGQFDLTIETISEKFKGEIAIEGKQWSVGIIVGNSGTGKSTIAKELYPDAYFNGFTYDDKSVIDNMPSNKKTEEITATFNSVGFATVWSWLKPYSVLSTGEKMRVDIARAILSDNNMIVFDEFTSVVDRTVAKVSSFAISKAIRKLNKQFIAVSCHYDIIEWMEPDWIYDTNEQRFFFVKANTNDQKSNLKSDVVQRKNGTHLKNIII